MSSKNRTFYKFKEFQLEVDERSLLQNEVPVVLPPKTFDLLALLVERSGRLVEKDELLRIVWDDAFVEEANISRVIYSLRKTLGEDSENKFIETVSKKGYRFIAKVEESNAPEPAEKKGEDLFLEGIDSNVSFLNASRLPDSESENGRGVFDPVGQHHSQKASVIQSRRGYLSLRGPKYLFLGAIVLSVLLIAFVINITSIATKPISTDKARSLAVLPLRPISEESRDPIYELGIAESLILKLNSARQLTVRPLSAIRKYQNLNGNPLDDGRDQQVDFVLSSNYQIADGRIRVTAQLINVQTGVVEETFKCENVPSNIFSMQDAIAGDIGNKLLARFGSRENTLTTARRTSNEEAYRLYLQAAFIFDQWNKIDAEKAVAYLERAVALDPDYAQAYIMLAYAYRFFPHTKAESLDAQVLKSKTAIKRALEIDANSADAHAVAALLKFSYDRDFAGAERDFKRAIELNSSSIMTHALYAYYLLTLGRFDEALTENNKALELDPSSFSHQITHGMLLYHSRRYSEGLTHYQKLIAKDKNFVYGYFWMWLLYDLLQDEAQAYEWFMKYQTQIKASPETIAKYQNAHQRSGWKGILHEIIEQDERVIATDKNSSLLYEVACINARLGNTNKSLDYLEKAYAARNSSMVFIKVDPFLELVRNDSRFTRIAKQVGVN